MIDESPKPPPAEVIVLHDHLAGPMHVFEDSDEPQVVFETEKAYRYRLVGETEVKRAVPRKRVQKREAAE